MANNVYIEEQWDENFYARLDTNGMPDTETPWGSVSNIVAKEKFNIGSPLVSIRFVDALGVLMSSTHIEPQHPFNFIFGQTSNDTMKMELSMSEYQVSELASGQTGNVFVDVDFLTRYWTEMFNTVKSRSWSDARYSDVVNIIAEEVGFTDINIEPTDDTFDVIQPNWTNFQMLQWLRQQSVSRSGFPDYYMGITLDGQFFFRTMEKMSSQKPKSTIVITPDDLSGNAEEFEDVESAFAYDFSHVYTDRMTNGAAGVKHQHFDWNTKSFITDTTKVSETEYRQLSQWHYMAEEDQTVPSSFYGSRDTNTPNRAEARMMEAANSILSVKLSIYGNIEYHIGDIISLLVIPSEDFNIDFSKVYSGYYMVTEVEHNILIGKRQFITELKLQRQGTNDDIHEGLVKTATGKKIASAR